MKNALETVAVSGIVSLFFIIGYLSITGSILWIHSNFNDNKIYRYDFIPDNNLTNSIESWNNNSTENKFINWRTGFLSPAGAGGIASVSIHATTPQEFIELQQQMDSDGPVFFESTWKRSRQFSRHNRVTNKWSFLAWNRNGYISYEDSILTDKCYPLYIEKDPNGVAISVITIGKSCNGEKFSEETIEWTSFSFWPFTPSKSEVEIIAEVKNLLGN